MNQKIFTARKVELTDDSELYEVITSSGERIASFVGETAEEDSNSFADALNDVCLEAVFYLDSDISMNA